MMTRPSTTTWSSPSYLFHDFSFTHSYIVSMYYERKTRKTLDYHFLLVLIDITDLRLSSKTKSKQKNLITKSKYTAKVRIFIHKSLSLFSFNVYNKNRGTSFSKQRVNQKLTTFFPLVNQLLISSNNILFIHSKE